MQNRNNLHQGRLFSHERDGGRLTFAYAGEPEVAGRFGCAGGLPGIGCWNDLPVAECLVVRMACLRLDACSGMIWQCWRLIAKRRWPAVWTKALW